MAHETEILWMVFLGIGVAVLSVVILLLGLLRESVKSLGNLVSAVWSSAVGVFAHTVTAAPRIDRATEFVRKIRAGAAS